MVELDGWVGAADTEEDEAADDVLAGMEEDPVPVPTMVLLADVLDERVGLIGPAVLVNDGAAVPVPDMVLFIDMLDELMEELVGLTGAAVPVPDMVLLADALDERVGLIGPAVLVNDGAAVPVPDMVLFDAVEERI